MNKREHRDLVAQYFLAERDLQEDKHIHADCHDVLKFAFQQTIYTNSDILTYLPVRSKKDGNYYLLNMSWDYDEYDGSWGPAVKDISRIKSYITEGFPHGASDVDLQHHPFFTETFVNKKALINEFVIVVYRRYVKVKNIINNLKKMDLHRRLWHEHLIEVFANERHFDDYEWGEVQKKRKTTAQMKKLHRKIEA